MKLFLVISAVLISVSTASAGGESVGCRDDEGNFVDYMYGYKLPASIGPNDVEYGRHSSGGGSKGLNYLYVTSKTDDKWRMSEKFINDSSSFAGRTLGGIYGGGRRHVRGGGGGGDLLVLMYNDEPTMGAADESRGHTKGVLIANNTNGMWLIHSVPKFPPTPEEGGYGYPKNGQTYGQSFLCISLTGDQLGKVGRQLQYNEPHFYYGNIPDDLKS